MNQHQVGIATEKCVGCGLCANVCVAHNIRIVHKKAEILLENCAVCGQCSAVCPQKAVSIHGYDNQAIEKKEELRLDPELVLNVIRFRRSIRQFQKKQISEDIIWQILEAGRLTHTAENLQDVSFIVLRTQKDRLEHGCPTVQKNKTLC